ncbi:MAG: hypothetical protein HYU69_16760 [Bacteroidetes bacterium]|nr:hypothetical protein [Bacteroidota bacterium]
MDIGTGLTILGSKEIVGKILGPTADYLGKGLKDFTEKRVDTLKNIFSNAGKKLGKKLDEESGGVSPKVLKGIINEGSYCDDFLSVDYFGGVLASSRSGISRDDRGAYFNALISRLSSYQLRLHYIMYHTVKELYNGESTNVAFDQERNNLRVFIPIETYAIAMDFVEEEKKEISNLINHSIFGLLKEDLIDGYFQFGGKEHIQKTFPESNVGGMILQPSPLGIELFLWAYGKGQVHIQDFLKNSITFEIDEKIKLSGEKKKIKN